MEKLKILYTFWKWLYREPHKNGLKCTINRIEPNYWEGESWFIVEPTSIWIPYDQMPDARNGRVVTDTLGNRYVRIGGGDQAGKYVFVGDDEPVEKGEPSAQ